jgi:hypothetical protein
MPTQVGGFCGQRRFPYPTTYCHCSQARATVVLSNTKPSWNWGPAWDCVAWRRRRWEPPSSPSRTVSPTPSTVRWPPLPATGFRPLLWGGRHPGLVRSGVAVAGKQQYHQHQQKLLRRRPSQRRPLRRRDDPGLCQRLRNTY